MKSTICIFAVAAALCGPGAWAKADPRISITSSPLHLALPMLEFTGEFGLSPKMGVAGILGYGQITERGLSGGNFDIPVLELGAQANYYVVGTFRHGMQLGGELLWMKISPPDNQGITVSANGVAIGPYLGYKWAARFGLTLLVQGGYQFIFAQAKATDATGQEIEGSGQDGILLLNLNIGWSF